MSAIYVSCSAYPEVLSRLAAAGRVCAVQPDARLGPVGSHADLRYCALGSGPRAPLFRADGGELGGGYPASARACALVVGNYFIHRLDITLPRLLAAAKALGLVPVNVRQGYARCSAAVVGGRGAVTADPGMAAALRRLPGVDVLEIRPGFVALPGFETGFIGGACGMAGGELVFNGDASLHPDFPAIRQFAAERGVEIKYFPGLPLTDVGSIIESGE